MDSNWPGFDERAMGAEPLALGASIPIFCSASCHGQLKLISAILLIAPRPALRGLILPASIQRHVGLRYE